ncbi:MAG: ribosome small subunit-dependent GTPase A [Spirochaetaceae bacterium]|jgi:ribosome biogenesis GTPase|nr:ribosome small subunit-dependent GTPase A [Spirochaetaceae bacterium]
MTRGLVVRGSRNIFTVRLESGTELECRIKGKVLKGVDGYYNPLAPGDWVTVAEEPSHPRKGSILGLEKRRNVFSRRNQKGLGPNRSAASQLLAANVDLVLCVTSPGAPPFRPRFLDRLLLQTDIAGIPGVIICNKWDLFDGDPDVEERLEDFHRIGYEVLRVSAKTGVGLDSLRALLENRFSVLVGQSGVGKSSLVNALIPETSARVGALNEKYDRGNHTTSMSVVLELPEGKALGKTPGEGGTSRVIDTPGIRRFVPDGVTADQLILHMREFSPLAGKCSFGLSCSHRTEPGCKIMEAVAAGFIHEDRYDSFLRIQDELLGTYYDD